MPQGAAQQQQILIEEEGKQSKPPSNSLVQSLAQTPLKEQNAARLVTEESIDSQLPANEKLYLKLQHYIRKQRTECQPTTIDFYKIGKVLGKGAFGKVNLAL